MIVHRGFFRYGKSNTNDIMYGSDTNLGMSREIDTKRREGHQKVALDHYAPVTTYAAIVASCHVPPSTF